MLRRWLPFLLLGLIAAAQLQCVPGQYLGAEHDDAQYALAARSLLRGRYALGISPGDPALTFNTPGWAVLLAPAALVSGDSAAGYQLWAWGWLALCDLLLWLWLRRRLDARLALAATALFGLNPLVLSRSGVVMSEVPALAAALGLLLMMERPGGLRGWAAGLWLGGAWLIRPGAVALWPAVWGKYAAERRWKELLGCAACAAAPVLAWKAWVGRHGDRLAEVQELSLFMPREAAGLCRVALHNARGALSTWGHTVLPAPPQAVGDGAALLAGVLLAAAALAAVAALARRRGYEAAGAYLLCGMALHALWPYWYERYLVPYLPFLVWGLAVAAVAAWRGDQRRAAWTLLALAALSAPQAALLARGRDARRLPELSGTYAWIRGNTEPSALFSSAFYCRDAWYTGHPFVPLPGSGLRQVLGERRVRYVLWQEPPDLGSSRGASFPLARELRDDARELSGPGFRKVLSVPDEGTVVYEVLAP